MAYDEKANVLTYKIPEEDKKAVAVCEWPHCECEVGRMCDGAIAQAFMRMEEQNAKLGAVIAEVQALLNSRMPKGRL